MKENSREAEWKQRPEQTVGVDLGDRFSRYCVLDQEGEVIEEGRVKTDREAWRQHWEGEPRQRVVMETGTHSPWASRLLQELGHQVIVANARKLRAITEMNPRMIVGMRRRWRTWAIVSPVCCLPSSIAA